MDKKSLRKEMLEKRNSIPKEVRHKKSLVIKEKLLSDPDYKACESLFCYLSFRSETETEEIITAALYEGKTVALPYMTEKKGEMVFVKISSLADLVKNSFGIYEPVPKEENIVFPTDKTVIIVPGAVFSKDGGRIGYGGGYYDRYLSRFKSMCTIGIGFREQLCDKIPADKYDIGLDKIITD